MGGDGIRYDRTTMTKDDMTLTKRTCSTCCAFNPAPEGDDPACWNLTSIIEHNRTPQELHRQPLPNDWCDGHQTHEEDRAEDAAIGAFWQTLGIAPRLGRCAD